MQNLNKRVNRLFHKKEDDKLIESIVSLMKYFSWTLEDVKKLPIPSYLEIIETVNKIEEEAKKKSK